MVCGAGRGLVGVHSLLFPCGFGGVELRLSGLTASFLPTQPLVAFGNLIFHRNGCSNHQLCHSSLYIAFSFLLCWNFRLHCSWTLHTLCLKRPWPTRTLWFELMFFPAPEVTQKGTCCWVSLSWRLNVQEHNYGQSLATLKLTVSTESRC